MVDFRDPAVRAIEDQAQADRAVEDILRQMDARKPQTIYGPDGKTPLYEPLVDDRTITYAKDGESYSIKPEELLMRAARMQRDGKSLANIRAELDLVHVPDQLLEAALRLGHEWLNEAIAAGREPEESVRVLGYREAEDDDTNEATVEDAKAVGLELARDWIAR
jgi:hypothetical protein